jgi:hypothetical protein
MLRTIAVFAVVACLAACVGAPVQEMSDARQAIAAARVAGAQTRAPADFNAAQASIERAELNLQAGDFTRARIAAIEAKGEAAAALAHSEQANGPDPAH